MYNQGFRCGEFLTSRVRIDDVPVFEDTTCPICGSVKSWHFEKGKVYRCAGMCHQWFIFVGM